MFLYFFEVNRSYRALSKLISEYTRSVWSDSSSRRWTESHRFSLWAAPALPSQDSSFHRPVVCSLSARTALTHAVSVNTALGVCAAALFVLQINAVNPSPSESPHQLKRCLPTIDTEECSEIPKLELVSQIRASHSIPVIFKWYPAGLIITNPWKSSANKSSI